MIKKEETSYLEDKSMIKKEETSYLEDKSMIKKEETSSPKDKSTIKKEETSYSNDKSNIKKECSPSTFETASKVRHYDYPVPGSPGTWYNGNGTGEEGRGSGMV